MLKDIRMPFTNIKISVILIVMRIAESVFVSNHVKLEADYSKETLPPTEEGAPLLLRASVNLRNILEVIETKQQIRYKEKNTKLIFILIFCPLILA